jgi:serine/threonine protein kinase
LELVREHLPDHEPWRAWSNFEFIDDQGRVNEVDLLLLCPRGLVLVEIKSRPGTVEGDAHSWAWSNEGRRTTADNPLLLANRKAKRLAGLLQQQDAFAKGRARVPYVAEAVFLSNVKPPLRLQNSLRKRVFLRGQPGRDKDDGIVQALVNGLDAFHRDAHVDSDTVRAVERAMQQAGIRPSLAHRRIGDYELQAVIGEGEGFQDFTARHLSQGSLRRVRLYAHAPAASNESRARLTRLAVREFQVLEGIDHPGILRVLDYRDSDRGPALILEHDPEAQRLDHFLRERGRKLSTEARLDLWRQIAEAIRHAHEKRLYHRALSPLSVVVRQPRSDRPRIKVMNWQTAARNDTSLPTPQRTAGTAHIDEYLADPARLYVAPEAREGLGPPGPHLDVFSLGTIGYLLFTNEPPASSPLELPEKLRRHDGLRISQAINGVNGYLDDLIHLCTKPDVGGRIESVAEFLGYLAEVERELSSKPAAETVADPGEARPGDRLEHGLLVKERLGSGGSSEALLVTREADGAELVLKIARDGGHNDRLRAEAEALKRLRHPNIVSYRDTCELAGRVGILMDRAGKQTLAQLIRSEHPPSLDLACRFGEELLDAVRHLEDEGVQHRDIKPDNIGIADAPGSGKKRLVLFDLSLTRTPLESLEAGTRPYLDPFLPLRKPPRWDLYAERFAAAVTLYEMLTGQVPRWGDGLSDPALLEDEAAIEAERFDPALRDGLHEFFSRALRRECVERFGNAEEMLRAWRRAFEALGRQPDAPESLEAIARRIRAETPVAELGYGIEARDVLDKMGVHTVAQLLAQSRRQLRYLRNVGERIRREIRERAKRLAHLRPDLKPGARCASSRLPVRPAP